MEENKIATEHVVVLLIDMQVEYVNCLAKGDQKTIIGRQLQAVRACAEKDVPLVVLEYEGSGPTIAVLEQEILKVPRTKTIIKPCNDGFSETALAETLAHFGAKKLILMGVNASCCVLKTARSGVSLGYEILTAEDVIADCRCAKCGAKNKSKLWYAANGHFLPALSL